MKPARHKTKQYIDFLLPFREIFWMIYSECEQLQKERKIRILFNTFFFWWKSQTSPATKKYNNTT